MPPIAIQLSVIEIAVLCAGLAILGLAIHFFISSRRSLKQALQRSQAEVYARPGFYGKPVVEKDRPEKPARREAQKESAQSLPAFEELRLASRPKPQKEDSVEHLKETIMQQQRLLNGFLRQVEEIETEGKEEMELENRKLHEEIRDLEARLEKKSADIDDLHQKAATAERMAARIEEVYSEFEQLQAKMQQLEKQAGRANNLALELEDTRQAYEGVHKDLLRKNEKLEELFAENQRLQGELNTVEDKLAEANLQRQQLQKKVLFLQDLNTDLQSVSDTNKKMQTELRRIGELESMLNMIAEERDFLLRRSAK